MKQAFLKDMAPDVQYGRVVEWPGFHMGHTHKGLSFISPSSKVALVLLFFPLP